MTRGEMQRLHAPGMARRFACMAYEALSLFAVLFVAFLLPQAGISFALSHPAPDWVLWTHVFFVALGYFMWFWQKGGQTLAMKTWKIRLVAASGTSVPTTGQAVLRYLLSWPSLLCFGLGLFWAFVDRDRQYLHDRLAGTRLVLAV